MHNGIDQGRMADPTLDWPPPHWRSCHSPAGRLHCSHGPRTEVSTLGWARSGTATSSWRTGTHTHRDPRCPSWPWCASPCPACSAHELLQERGGTRGWWCSHPDIFLDWFTSLQIEFFTCDNKPCYIRDSPGSLCARYRCCPAYSRCNRFPSGQCPSSLPLRSLPRFARRALYLWFQPWPMLEIRTCVIVCKQVISTNSVTLAMLCLSTSVKSLLSW